MSDGKWIDCYNCRQRFFSYGKTKCRSCELDPVLKCHVCGAEATCTGELGLCCDKLRCHNIDSVRASTRREMEEVMMMCRCEV